jgi:hypothetical protein
MFFCVQIKYIRLATRILRLLKTLRLSDSSLAKHYSALDLVGSVVRGAGPVALSAATFILLLTFVFAVVGQVCWPS